MRSWTGITVLAVVALSVLFTGCNGGGDGRGWVNPSDAALRGQGTFATFCATCHNYRDPFSAGVQGPPIARSSLKLLQAKVLRGEYPDGYTPKRPGPITMPVQKNLNQRMGDLYAFLQEVPDPSVAESAGGK